jgi:beta-lactamase superfamily II metal-dependent hydrolase
MMKIGNAVLCLAALACAARAGTSLETYVIDVEGGKSVLTVSPSGESLLFDIGWPGYAGRDVNRIVEAAKAAGLKQIDYLVISHYDVDHLGDVPALLAAFPVKHIVDNGALLSTAKGVEVRYKTFAAARDAVDHMSVKPGDKIPINGLDVTVLEAAGKGIPSALPGAGAANPACATTPRQAENPADLEDNMSIGLLFTLGKFRMLDLADLESPYEYNLVCPNNLIGTVDVYQVSGHGSDKSVSGVVEPAIHALVAMMGNGARKGGSPAAWPILRNAAGLEDIWQVHLSLAGGKDNNPPEDYIANLEAACQGKWLQLSAAPDGTFTITNSRNGFHKTYPARN